MIVDCHVHIASQLTGFWAPLRHGRVRDKGQTIQVFPPAFDPPASPPELALCYMDLAGVDRAFIVQHHLYGNQNAAVLDAARRWPDRFVGFASLGPLNQPDGPERLERLLGSGLSGLKVELQSTRRLRPAFRFDGEREWAIWQRLNDLKRPLIVDINEGTAEDTVVLGRVIEALPNLRMAVCHAGGAPRAGWEERALLAQHPRVWLDLASLQSPFGAEHEYPYPREQEVIRWAVEHVGAERIMWGTDYPGTLVRSTYQQLLDVVVRHCTFLSSAQKEWILGGAAQRFLGEI